MNLLLWQVKGEVYNLIIEKDSPSETLLKSSASTRESRVQARRSVVVEEEVQNRELTAAELKLQSEYIKKQRELEAIQEQLQRLQQHNNNNFRVQLTTAGVCSSMNLEAPPRKRMRSNGHGREEALVLNSTEQLQAAKARQALKQRQGDMKQAIKQAKTKHRAANKTLKADIKKVTKYINDMNKAVEKANSFEKKAADCITAGDKKAASIASAAITKVAQNTESALKSGEEALTKARDSLLEATRCQEHVKRKETELQELQDAVIAVAEDDDSDIEEEEGEEEDSQDPYLSSLVDLEAQFEEAKKGHEECLRLADLAATSALVSAMTSVIVKAVRKEQKQAQAAANRAAARPVQASTGWPKIL